MLAERPDGHVAQRGDGRSVGRRHAAPAERLRRGLHRRAPRVVGGVGQAARDAAVHDHDRHPVRGHRHRLVGQRPAVEQDRVAGAARPDGDLVHDPALHAGVVVLHALGEESRLGLAQLDAPRRRQPERDGDRERGRRRQAGADRHVAGDEKVGPAGRLRGLRGDLAGDAEHVARPQRMARGRRAEPPARLAEPVGHDANGAVGAGPHDRVRAAVDRHREHEPARVVGVVADQVDAAGRVGGPHGALAGKGVGKVRACRVALAKQVGVGHGREADCRRAGGRYAKTR